MIPDTQHALDALTDLQSDYDAFIDTIRLQWSVDARADLLPAGSAARIELDERSAQLRARQDKLSDHVLERLEQTLAVAYCALGGKVVEGLDGPRIPRRDVDDSNDDHAADLARDGQVA